MTDKPVEALEPCAHCEAPGYLITDRAKGTFKVKCTGCEIQTKPGLYRNAVVAAWNRRALSSRPDAGEAVAWMYEHPGHAQFGIPPIIQTERATDRSPDDGWVETALGKIAHQTAAVAGEGERPAGWTYEYDSGTGWETHTVLNTPPNLPTKLAPAKHYGSSDIRNVRAFFYSRSQPAADAVGTGREAAAQAIGKVLGIDIYEKCSGDIGEACDSSTCPGALTEDHDVDEHRERIYRMADAALAAALSTPPRQPDDAVREADWRERGWMPSYITDKISPGKPLHWRKPTDHPQDSFGEPDVVAVADGIGGRYSIREDSYGVFLWWAHDEFTFEACANVAEAKAKAERDWQDRLRALLASTKSPDAEHPLRKMVALDEELGLYDDEKVAPKSPDADGGEA